MLSAQRAPCDGGAFQRCYSVEEVVSGVNGRTDKRSADANLKPVHMPMAEGRLAYATRRMKREQRRTWEKRL